jgi:hypothetical protein
MLPPSSPFQTPRHYPPKPGLTDTAKRAPVTLTPLGHSPAPLIPRDSAISLLAKPSREATTSVRVEEAAVPKLEKVTSGFDPPPPSIPLHWGTGRTSPGTMGLCSSSTASAHRVAAAGKKETNGGRGIVACGKRTDFGYDKDFEAWYSLGKLLGHGQFGYTFAAVDCASGERVAVKRIDKNKVPTRLFVPFFFSRFPCIRNRVESPL